MSNFTGVWIKLFIKIPGNSCWQLLLSQKYFWRANEPAQSFWQKHIVFQNSCQILLMSMKNTIKVRRINRYFLRLCQTVLIAFSWHTALVQGMNFAITELRREKKLRRQQNAHLRLTCIKAQSEVPQFVWTRSPCKYLEPKCTCPGLCICNTQFA